MTDQNKAAPAAPQATREEAPANTGECPCNLKADDCHPDCPHGREEAPAEAGADDLAARLRRAETWDLDADQEAHDRCGVLMLEAAERLEAREDALRVAVEALEPFARLDVLDPSGVIIGLERYHFERARQALAALQAEQGVK